MRCLTTTALRVFRDLSKRLVLLPVIALGLSGTGPPQFGAGEATALRSAIRVPPADSLRGPAFFSVDLQPLRTAQNRARGRAALWFPDSPFTVATTPEGFYVWSFTLKVWKLPRRPNTVYVAWLAAPDLDPLRKIGVVEEGKALSGRVDFDNQFIFFVTAERTPDVERPKGAVMLRGISRSGYLDSMFGHGFCPRNEEC